MATYVNNLRLTELATGEGSGTWGTTTNTSLELIGEALGYNTQNCFSSDADATTTIADGATDPARAFYFKVTSSATLTATRTLTIAPNTISRVMFIENATTGSQSITISQGSGANVTIATGRTAVVYLDGAGSGAAVVDAMANVDPGITDTLAEVLAAGNTSGGTGLTMSSGDDLTLTGASYNAVWDSSADALEFGDNAKAVFGTGSDLQIYHDGSNSFVDDNGVGNLFIRSVNGDSVRLYSGGGASSNLRLLANSAGELSLYHSGSKKLDTTSTGIDVTGTVTADGLTVDGDPALNGNVTITNTGTGAAAGPYLTLDRNSSSPADSDLLGILSFRGRDDGANATDYGTIAGKIADVTGGTEDGVMLFNVISGGSSRDVLTLSHNESVFNNGSADQDFRVESDANTHALFVDAGNSRVGINESSPNAILHVKTNSTDEMLRLEMVDDSATSGPDIVMQRVSASPATNDSVGRIRAIGENSSGSGVTYGRMEFFIDDPTAGSESGLFSISTELAGANIQRLAFKPDEVVFNEPSADSDFRVESNSNSHMLFVDAGNNQIGIGTNGTQATLHVFSSNSGATPSSAADDLFIEDSGNAGITIGSGTSSAGQIRFADSDSSGRGIVYYDHSGDLMALYTAGSERFRITATTATFNEDSNDQDFRVESNNKGNMFFIDAGTDTAYFGAVDNRGFVNIEKEAPLASDGAFTSPHLSLQAQAQPTDNDGFVGMSLATSDSDNYGFTIGAQRTTGGQGNLVFRNHFNSATGTEMMAIKSGSEVVFNEDGNGQNFRVESDSNSHMLFVDAGNNQVIIGDGTAVGSALFLQRFSSANGYTTTNDTRYATGKQVIFNESNTTTTFAGITLLTGATSGGTVELNAIRHGTALRSDFAIKTRDADGNSSEKLRLTGHDGHLGIGVDDPLAPLSISKTPDTNYGVANFAVPSGNPTWVTLNRDGSQDGGFKIQRSTTADMRLFVNSDETTILNYNGGNTGDSFQIIQGAGSGALVATFDSGNNIIFNDNSGDQDFRVESNNQSHMLFVDGGENNIGVRNSSPLDPLHILINEDNNANRLTGGNSADLAGGLKVENDNTAVDSFAGMFLRSNTYDVKLVASTGSASNEGEFMLLTDTSGGDMALSLYIDQGETVFNEDSRNQDFRVESNNNTHMLFVDAGVDHVIVGGSVNYENSTFQVQGAKNLVVGIPQEGVAVTDTTAVAAGVGGAITFNGKYNTAGEYTNFASIEGEKRISTSGHYDGALVLKARTNGSDAHERARFDEVEAVINGTGRDTDFRVESDANTHALFVEGSGTGIAVNDSNTNATGWDSTVKLGGGASGGGLVAYVEEINVANGSYIDVNIGNSSINYWTGMLGVNCSSMSNGSNRTQSLISILANNQFPGFNTSVLHTADGTSARSFTVTYVATGTIRITNTSGDTVGISAWFTGGGTQF